MLRMDKIVSTPKIKEEIIALNKALAETRSALEEELIKERKKIDLLLEQILKQEASTAEKIIDLTEKCVEVIKEIIFLQKKVGVSSKDAYEEILRGLDTGSNSHAIPETEQPSNEISFQSNLDKYSVADSSSNLQAVDETAKKDPEQDYEKTHSHLAKQQPKIDQLASTCNSPAAANVINEDEAVIEELRKAFLAETKTLLVEASERSKTESIRLQQEMLAARNKTTELANLNEYLNRLIEKETKLIDLIKTGYYGSTSPVLFTAVKNGNNDTKEVINNKNNIGLIKPMQ